MDNPDSEIEVKTVEMRVSSCLLKKEFRRASGGFRLCTGGKEVLLFMTDREGGNYEEWVIIPIDYFRAMVRDIPMQEEE